MTLVVHEVTARRDREAFIDFPFRLYQPDVFPNWVAPLRVSVRDVLSPSHPFWRTAACALYLARRDGLVVGRIAAIENRAHNTFHGDQTGFFGFFECVDDQAVADALFASAGEWLRRRGLRAMLGPMNPGTNYECGLLVEGFARRPQFMTAWNPPYYDVLCRQAGLTKAKDLFGFWFSVEGATYEPPEYLRRLVEHTRGRGRVTFRDVDMAHYDRDVDLCWEMYNDAWERNWGFVPMTREEFLHSAKDLKPLLARGFSFIASVDGEPAGFCLALPDYNETLQHHRSGRLLPFGLLRLLWHRNRWKGLRVFALGVRRTSRSRGVLALFAHELMRRGRASGRSGAEASWLLEDNTMIVKPMRAMGATHTMTWRLYEQALSPEA